MPKEDCKYWDKCYQRNPEHLQKYNHPEKKTEQANAVKDAPPSGTSTDTGTEAEKVENGTTTEAKYCIKDIEKAAKDFMRSTGQVLLERYMQSEVKEYENLLQSKEFIRQKFLVEMPPDFYQFWEFLLEWRPDATPQQTLQHLEQQFQLQLVGPYDFLAGRFNSEPQYAPGAYLRHWRFYYDPPEFQTIFVKKDTGVHYGYWRDLPNEHEQLLVARNDANKGCEFEFVAGNVFEAVRHYLDKDCAATPFTAAGVQKFKKTLLQHVEKKQLQLPELAVLRKQRAAKVVAKTFHRAGIVVPYDSKTQVGYRPLLESDAELKKILELFKKAGGQEGDDTVKKAVTEKLRPLATAATIALDECDFGTSLELGIDLFCSGHTELHKMALSLLVPAYAQLERPQYIAIVKTHMENRIKGNKLSIFENEGMTLSEDNNSNDK